MHRRLRRVNSIHISDGTFGPDLTFTVERSGSCTLLEVAVKIIDLARWAFQPPSMTSYGLQILW